MIIDDNGNIYLLNKTWKLTYSVENNNDNKIDEDNPENVSKNVNIQDQSDSYSEIDANDDELIIKK